VETLTGVRLRKGRMPPQSLAKYERWCELNGISPRLGEERTRSP
jgi:hypothetical protein